MRVLARCATCLVVVFVGAVRAASAQAPAPLPAPSVLAAEPVAPRTAPHTSVTPDGGPGGATTVPSGSSGNSVTFTITNGADHGESYSLSCDRSGLVVSCAPGVSSIQVGANSAQQVAVSFAVGIGPGSGSVSLTAVSDYFELCEWWEECPPDEDAGYYDVTVSSPPGPSLDLTLYHPRRVDYGTCLHACFAATYAQSTTPYVSLDTPRAVTLVYNADRTALTPFVFVDVAHVTSQYTPTRYELQVRVNGALVPFVNGEQTLRFAYPGPGAHRLGGQLDASAYAADSAYPMEIRVTSIHAGGAIASSLTTHLVVLDERDAPLARGWTIAGWQRLYPLAGGAVLIAEGDGSYTHFLKSGGVLHPPAGDFTKVTDTGPDTARYVRIYPDSTRLTFNSGGRLTKIVDRFGTTTRFTYDGANRPWKITDPQNLTITLTYGAHGLAAVTDPFGRATQVTVQANRTLTALQDPDGVSTTFGYDGSLRLQAVTDRRGNTTTLGYDSQSGKLATVTAPTVSVYGVGNANPVTTFDPWQKDGVPYGSTASPFAPVPRESVDARVTAPDGVVTRYRVFDRHGQPIYTYLPYGLVDTTSFNEHGQVLSHRGPLHPPASYAYDSQGFLTWARVDTVDTYFRKGGWAQPDSIWGDTPGRFLFLGVSGRVDSIRHAGQDSLVQDFTYDGSGRLVTARDFRGHLLTRRWYAGTNGNTSKDSAPGGRVTTWGHDTYGRVTSLTAPGLPTRTVTYDALNRPRSLYDGPSAAPTVLAYDSLYLRSVTDPKGQVYQVVRDAMGGVIARIDPAGGVDSTQYGWLGEVRRYVNRRGQAVTLGYDSLGRRTTRTAATLLDSLGYSPDGRLVTAWSPTTTETAYANQRGQTDSVRTVFAAFAAKTFWRRYTYDGQARLTAVTVTGTGLTFQHRSYTYHPDGTLGSLGFGTASTTFAYNGDLLPSEVTLPGTNHKLFRDHTTVHGVTWVGSVAVNDVYHYDAARRLDRVHHGDDEQQLFGYDGRGELTSLRRESGAVNCAGNYDPDHGWTCTGGYQYPLQIFAYDSAGNRTDLGGTYDAGNRITAFAGCTYGYDDDGNVTSRTCGGTTVAFTWNALNQLTSYAVGGNTINLGYDGFGRLVRQSGTGISEQNFLWDREHVYAALNSTGSALEAEYAYYPGLDHPHAVRRSGATYYAHTDGLGNVVALTDQSKTIRRTYQYDPWGQLTGGGDSANLAGRDRARFKGALWMGDAGVELYYMRNRWYEPKSGRFLSEDPVGPGGANSYTFALSNPVTLRDALGLSADSGNSGLGEHDHSNFYCENGGVYDIDFHQCWGWDGHLHDPDDPSGMAPHWAFHTNPLMELLEAGGRIALGGRRIGYMEEMPGVLVAVYEQPGLFGGCVDREFCGIALGNAIWVTDASNPRAIQHEMTHIRQIQAEGASVFYSRWLDSYHRFGRENYYCIGYERQAYESHGANFCHR
jgi:RHS repeat-associated protein